MSKKDPPVDAYIAKSADFAKPILNRIRKLVRIACPGVEETIKWNSPFFMHKGILIAMSAFKQHCALIFWKNKLIFGKEAASQRKRFHHITSMADLPGDKILLDYIRKAVELNEAGVKNPVRAKSKAKKPVVPDYLLAALKENKKALVNFENFSSSCQREYVEWLTEAKREETRAQRLKTAVQWIAEGKSRNWKYL
jgi:uncharacterized protein YdeI (YjbR/CyaY-like superfamily)